MAMAWILWSMGVWAGEFEPGVVRDFPIKSMGTLQIRNQRGSIRVSSWTLDKVRVTATRAIKPEIQTGADTAKQTAGPPLLPEIRFKDLGNGQMELFADYGRGLGIQDKVKELNRGAGVWSDGIDLTIKAPPRLGLRLLSKDGAIEVSSWASSIESRSQSGKQLFEDLRSSDLKVFCPECEIQVKDARANIRILGGTGTIRMNRVSGERVYVESTQGEVKVGNIQGEQTYVSQDGAVEGQSLDGTIQFDTQKGPVHLEEVRGSVNGRTVTGNIKIGLSLWRGAEKGMIESQVGNINVVIPSALWNQTVSKIQATSAKGEVLVRPTQPRSVNPQTTQK